MRYSELFTTLCIVFITATLFLTTYKPPQFKFNVLAVNPSEHTQCLNDVLDFDVSIKILHTGVVQRVESIFRISAPQGTVREGLNPGYFVWGQAEVGLLIIKHKHVELKGLPPGKYVFNGSATQLGTSKSSIYSVPFTIVECKPKGAS